jgi:hypothetical protein
MLLVCMYFLLIYNNAKIIDHFCGVFRSLYHSSILPFGHNDPPMKT